MLLSCMSAASAAAGGGGGGAGGGAPLPTNPDGIVELPPVTYHEASSGEAEAADTTQSFRCNGAWPSNDEVYGPLSEALRFIQGDNFITYRELHTGHEMHTGNYPMSLGVCDRYGNTMMVIEGDKAIRAQISKLIPKLPALEAQFADELARQVVAIRKDLERERRLDRCVSSLRALRTMTGYDVLAEVPELWTEALAQGRAMLTAAEALNSDNPHESRRQVAKVKLIFTDEELDLTEDNEEQVVDPLAEIGTAE